MPLAFFDLFTNSTLRTVALGTMLLGMVSGVLGTFAVLRKQSLIGDAVSHSALPGIAIAFLLVGQAPIWFVIGAAISGWLATLVVTIITRNSRISFDTALAGTLAVFFGFGLVLMTYIRNNVRGAGQSGLDRYLFGQAATMLEADIWLIGCTGLFAVLILLLFWKEIKILCFDPDYAASLGFPIRKLDILLMTLLVFSIVVGLQSVGVVLMSAMIVAPGVAARQWSNRLGTVVVLAGLFGGLSGVLGTFISDSLSRPGRSVPTGPTIVLCATAIVLLSFLARLIPYRSYIHSEPDPIP
jgi:manganese/zinc/iron transport system permease protein